MYPLLGVADAMSHDIFIDLVLDAVEPGFAGGGSPGSSPSKFVYPVGAVVNSVVPGAAIEVVLGGIEIGSAGGGSPGSFPSKLV